MLAGAAALATGAAPSFAAYGDSANVFGKVTNKSGEQAGEDRSEGLRSRQTCLQMDHLDRCALACPFF